MVFTIGVGIVGGEAAGESSKPNVLFISIDDLNDWVGSMGHPLARTPNIDRLAEQGTLFLNAHCQSPLCNPLRTTLSAALARSSAAASVVSSAARTTPAWIALFATNSAARFASGARNT
ncbi:MAG: hypothetical protein EA381_16660 [Planctomycetaceae bacterium]|nr:MAG: hypothetical protein EA381_16660 [Planctomycetaceae bacterium]